MYFTYNQNNSGGRFHYDAESGISHFVIIEANDFQEANYRAGRIGLYFDGYGDCSCCGDRWYEAWRDDGSEAPEVYGQDVTQDTFQIKNKWLEGYEVFVHKLDGTVTGYAPGE